MSGWRDGWFVVPQVVSWRDLDGLGHVNNAVYISYFEFARVRYWFEMLQDGKAPQDLDFIVARVECDYRVQLSLDESIEIRVRIGEMRGSSFDFESEVWLRDGLKPAATGKVVVVLFDWKTQKKRVIDADLRERVVRFQQGVPA